MWGGGFLKQASETSKYNHDLLRKTKNKKVSTTSKRIFEASRKLEFGTLSDLERRNLVKEIRKSDASEFRKKLLVILIAILAGVTWAILALN